MSDDGCSNVCKVENGEMCNADTAGNIGDS